MKLSFTRIGCLLGVLLGTGYLASAQTVYTPKIVTGYTADVIANGAGTVASSTNNAVDRGNSSFRWCFTDSTYVNPSGQRPVRALPNSGLIRSISTTGLRFQMASSSQNNSLRIDGIGSGTLTLASPGVATEVVVLATEGNGNTSPKTFLITFTDGTTQTVGNIQVPDWYSLTGATPAYIVGSRASYITNAFENDLNNPRLFEVHIPMGLTNYGKLVQSVTISKTSSDPVLNVMGLTLGVNCLGVPVGGQAVADRTTVCPGQAVQLSLTGNTTAGPITYQWQSAPAGSTTFANIGGATAATYTATPPTTTQYRALVICSQQSAPSAPVTVVAVPGTASLTYAAASFCQGATAPSPTFTPAGGTFSSSSGLTLNSTTGVINPATSTVGGYVVTYTPPATSCASAVTASLTVLPPATVALAYGGDFCRSGSAPLPSVAVPAGGTFSGSAGLVLNATTGAIDLTSTPNGTYTVTYTSGGACSSQATASVTVKGNLPPVYPNVLTPNGDGKNDKLRLRIADVSNYSLQVFNRWGRKVYEGSSATDGWDAADSSGGMYYYLVRYTDCAGRAQETKTWLEVIK